MAYPFEEDFASGIPSGFASIGGSGGVTVTWNDAQQATDLDFTVSQSFWRMLAAQQSDDFWFEMDAEILASSQSLPQYGFWLWTGVGSHEGHRLCTVSYSWEHSQWNSGGTEDEAGQTSSGDSSWAVVGVRRTLRIDVKRGPSEIWQFRIRADGEIICDIIKRQFTTFLPCIFGRGITLRIHRVAGGTPSVLSEAVLAHRRLPIALAQRVLVPENAAALRYGHHGLRPLLGKRNHYYHGDHRIAGTVKHRVKGVIADAPLQRRVLLIDQATYVVVRETWSNASTGAYSFDHIDPVPHYLVIAFDHARQHRAVIADNLRAQPMTESQP